MTLFQNKKKYFAAIIINMLTFSTALAQGAGATGINTSNPQATLDVVRTTNLPGSPEGIIAPRLTGLEIKSKDADYGAAQTGAMIYATSISPDTGTVGAKTQNIKAAGYYYFDGIRWQAFTGGGGASTPVSNAWSLLGNAGTTVGANFVGTADSVDLMFKVHGKRAGYLSAFESAVVNPVALGNNNAFGLHALENANGIYNSAGGLGASTIGGVENNAFGYKALYSNTTGGGNSAFGNQTLASSSSGTHNSAFGWSALSALTTGSGNVAVGTAAGGNITTEKYNIVIGAGTLATPINILTPGRDSQLNIGNVIWGKNLYSNDSSLQIGIGDGVSPFLGAHTLTIDGTVAVQGSVYTTSDRRLKTNIADLNYGLEQVMKLKPVTYFYKKNSSVGGQKRIGFIAQDLQPIVPEAVQGTEGDIDKGEVLTVSYDDIIPVLTKAIQEQQAVIEQQQQTIEELLKRVKALEK
jgi:uncharacterized coiled-coil protein SlyX